MKKNIRRHLFGSQVIPDNRKISFKLIKLVLDIFYIFITPITLINILLKSDLKYKNNKKIAVVLGGGPSFNDAAEKILIQNRSKFDLYTVNYYNKNSISEKLIPNFHLISDKGFFLNGSDEKNQENLELRCYLRKYDIATFIPVNLNDLRFKNRILFNDWESRLSPGKSRYFPRCFVSNSIPKVINLVLSKPYKRVYVLGFDYDFLHDLDVTDENKLLLKRRHSYGTSKQDWSKLFVNYSHAVSWIARDLQSFERIRDNRVRLISSGSIIDVYKRSTLSEFASTCGT